MKVKMFTTLMLCRADVDGGGDPGEDVMATVMVTMMSIK